MSHARNTGPMQASPRCGAQTRNGETCRAPALRGKTRCRMHGGAWGSGAPMGNQNARTHGAFTRDRIAEQGSIRALLDETRRLLIEITSDRPSKRPALRNK
jgi:glucans biosynthesis protein